MVASTSDSKVQMSFNPDQFALLTRSGQGKLCFINPLFLQLEVCKVSAGGCVGAV